MSVFYGERFFYCEIIGYNNLMSEKVIYYSLINHQRFADL